MRRDEGLLSDIKAEKTHPKVWFLILARELDSWSKIYICYNPGFHLRGTRLKVYLTQWQPAYKVPQCEM